MSSIKTISKTKRNIIRVAVIAIPLSFILLFIVTDYRRANVNIETSAVPQANELKPYLKISGATVLHTYNRHARGIMSGVSSPSFEYYLEYSSPDTDTRARELTTYLSSIGYTVKKAMYTKHNDCSLYGYPTRDASGYRITEEQARQFCKERVGHDDSDLFGTAMNGNKPYWVIYGIRGDQTVYAQITDEDFVVSSNDSWGEEYINENGFSSTKVKDGKTVVITTFARKE